MSKKKHKESPRNGHPTAQGTPTDDTLKFDIVKESKQKKS